MANRSRLTTIATLLLGCGVLVGCSQAPGATATTAGPNTPGWTGQTIVPGNNSTAAGDATATYNQQKWPLERR